LDAVVSSAAKDNTTCKPKPLAMRSLLFDNFLLFFDHKVFRRHNLGVLLVKGDYARFKQFLIKFALRGCFIKLKLYFKISLQLCFLVLCQYFCGGWHAKQNALEWGGLVFCDDCKVFGACC
jgi:hypothetical protein